MESATDMKEFIVRHGGLKLVSYDGKTSASDDVEIVTPTPVSEMVHFDI